MYLDARIHELPKPGIKNTKMSLGVINYIGLNEEEKLYLFIYACNKAKMYAFKKDITTQFGWTTYKIRKLIKGLVEGGEVVYESYSRPEWVSMRGKGYRVTRL